MCRGGVLGSCAQCKREVTCQDDLPTCETCLGLDYNWTDASVTSGSAVKAMSWNGGICSTCNANYLGSHTCDPEDLVRRAEVLMEMARERFDEKLEAGKPVHIELRR